MKNDDICLLLKNKCLVYYQRATAKVKWFVELPKHTFCFQGRMPLHAYHGGYSYNSNVHHVLSSSELHREFYLITQYYP